MTSQSLAIAFVGGLAGGLLLHKLLERRIRGAGNRGAAAVPPSFEDLKKNVLSEDGPRQVDESILKEQFARNIKFFGEPNQEKVANSFVIVVGAGGVGSHAAHMLVRSGVSKVRVIDFDQVTVSSLNRHAVARHGDVGIAKSTVLKQHFRDIAPHAEVDDVVSMFDAANANELLAGNPDYVLDCIDNIDTKVDLLRICHEKKIPVLSCMGAGAKGDPTKIRISDISETVRDELARAVRKRLAAIGIKEGVTCVYSTEDSGQKLLPLEEHQENDPDEYRPIASLRIRIIPVLGPVPASFGNTMAAFVLCQLAGKPFKPTSGGQTISKNQCNRLSQQLKSREFRVYQVGEQEVPFDLGDIQYLTETVYGGRSVVSGKVANVTYTRWDKSLPATVSNLVLMTHKEANAHEKLDNPAEFYDAKVMEKIRSKLKEAKEWEALRGEKM